MHEHDQRAWVRDAAQRLGIDLAQQCRDVFMTWDDVRHMAADPLATIGAHTNNHFAVKKLSVEEALSEMALSGQRIASEIGKPVGHFAYPYGNVAHAGPRDFDLAEQAGFTTAVTTRLGSVFPEHASHLHALPRVMVSGKYQKSAWLNVLASGLPGFVKNRGALERFLGRIGPGHPTDDPHLDGDPRKSCQYVEDQFNDNASSHNQRATHSHGNQ